MKKTFLKRLFAQEIINSEELKVSQNLNDYISYLLKENISLATIKNCFKKDFYINYYDLNEYVENNKALSILTYETAINYNVFPISILNNTLYLTMTDPLNIDAIDTLEIVTNLNIEAYFSNPSDISKYINYYYLPTHIKNISPNNINKTDNETIVNIERSPVVKLFKSIITSAITQNASDVHIEPNRSYTIIRFRIDGRLIEFKKISNSLHNNIISRIKIISNLDIGESRIPQEGHFKDNINNEDIDFRISIIPSINGESCVIRIIYSKESLLNINKLGFLTNDIIKIDKLLLNTYGGILITGPTGSGKTTTLYSFLTKLKSSHVKIITLEDPVENHISGITQININEKKGFTFENGLPFILRQDPDIIMIGEVRNKETAKIMTRASITGHMVLTTLHTNDAISTIIRLLNMGIEGYIISASIKGIISQRLVRKLCDNCKKEYSSDEAMNKLHGIKENSKVYKSVGCNKCNNIGYKGRFIVYEILEIDSNLSSLIEKNVLQNEIKDYLINSDFKTIKDSMIEHVLFGNTSIEEIQSNI